MSIITNNLPELAASIRQEHHLAEQHAMQAVNHAMEAGRLLIEAKALCSHGKWLSWLADNFEGSARTAQAYMRLYENRDALANTQRAAHLSVREALKMLAEPATKNDTVSHLPGWLPNLNDPEAIKALVQAAITAQATIHFARTQVNPEDFSTVPDWAAVQRELLHALKAIGHPAGR